MRASGVRLLLIPGLLAILVFGLACYGSEPTATNQPTPTTQPTATPHRTPVPGVDQAITETASFRVEVWTGPLLMMMMMTSFPIMSTMDQQLPVNHHLEVHIFDRSSGAKLTDVVPTVRITDQATGASRDLANSHETGASQGVSFVTACQISKHREVEPHFGDNLYLPDGTYTITVIVGEETAVSENIVVKAAGSPAM